MTVPRCLVIIPDGNRRWARSHNHSQPVGHTYGLLNCRRIAKAAFERGVEHVVLWAASESNLHKRDPREIAFLFRLLKRELLYRSKRTDEIGFHLCGAWQEVNADLGLVELVEKAHRKTAAHEKHLTVLFGYSGSTELVLAAEKAAQEGLVTKDSIREHLWTSHVPDVDLLIRTGVEDDPHWSDLLLPWQLQNTQLYFSDVCWPAFTIAHLEAAFDDYARRVRRAGA